MDERTEILMEEYKMSVDSHKRSFDEALNVLKFYTSIVLVVLGVVLLKNPDASLPSYILKYFFIILILLTLLAIFIHLQIIKRRTRNIRRINYLRDKIFKLKLGDDELKAYNNVTKFNIKSKNFITISTLGPVFLYMATLLLIIVIIFKTK